MTGTIVTFYSYKGGVGRTFMLANTALRLSQWGYRVLCIDWDLDAPGLGFYLRRWLDHEPERGLVDFILNFASANTDNDYHKYVLPVRAPGQRGLLDFLPAGSTNADDYIDKLQCLDWTDLYNKHDLGEYIESLRARWKDKYDFVLVDSRTGITDIGGICTVQLPELLVMLFTANEQNISGTADVARRTRAAHNSLPVDRAGLLIMPVPTRFDSREEYDRAMSWQRRFATDLAPFFGNWASRDVPVERLIGHLTVPYVSYWSFGEELPAYVEHDPSPEKIGYSLDTVAAAIAHRLTQTQLLAKSRDSFVAAAQRVGSRKSSKTYDVFVSYPRNIETLALQIGEALELRGLSVHGMADIQSSASLLDEIEDNLARSRHLLALISENSATFQVSEINTFLRQNLDDDSGRQVITVLTPGADPSMLPSSLGRFQSVQLTDCESDTIGELADRVFRALRIPLLVQGTMERERELGVSHPATVTALSELAEVYLTEGYFEDAVALFNRSLPELDRVLGRDDPVTLTLRNNLAQAYAFQGRIDDAIALLEPTLADRERVLGPDHRDTLISRASLANAYREKGRFDEAIALQESTLAARIRALGPGHSEVLASQHSLANSYQAKGQFDRAIPLLERTLAKSEQTLGSNHPDTMTSANSLASAYAADGRLVDAIQLYERTLAQRERVLGKNNPATLTSRNNLAIAYASEGRLDEAIRLLERTVIDRETTIGAEHPDTYKSRYELGRVYVLAGRLTQAVSELDVGPISLTGGLPSKIILVEAYSMLGKLAEANAVIAQVLTELGEKARRDPHMRLAESWLAAISGEMANAITLASDAADLAATSGLYYAEVDALHLRARFGDQSVAERLASLARRSGGPLVDLQSGHAEAVAANDGSALDEVAAAFEDIGALLYAADASAQAAAAHDQVGNRRRSLESAASANRLATLCGGAVTPALQAAATPMPLTMREREIAALVAAGLSNTEIADRLFVSVRTVEGHLYRAAMKLDLADRNQIAEYVSRSKSQGGFDS